MRRTTRSCLSGMLAVAAVGVFAGSLPETVVAASGATPPAVTFAYTGAPQTYVVPAGVCAVSVDAFGAQGGSGLTLSVAPGVDMPPVVPVPGGRGAGVTSRLAVVPGETLQVDVGGEGGGGPEATSGPEAGGWNGGGRGGDLHPVFGGGGGGASDVRQGGTSLGDRVVVAGGGGGSGAGSGSPYSDPQPTGGGGGATGKVGGPGRVVVLEGFGVPTVTQIGDGPGGGGGGSATAGGEPGSGQVVVGAPSGPDGEPGLLGRGGDAPAEHEPLPGGADLRGWFRGRWRGRWALRRRRRWRNERTRWDRSRSRLVAHRRWWWGRVEPGRRGQVRRARRQRPGDDPAARHPLPGSGDHEPASDHGGPAVDRRCAADDDVVPAPDRHGAPG